MVHNSIDMIERVLYKQKCIRLTTYKKNGEEISTPICFVQENEVIYIMSEDKSWKVKRLKTNPKVSFISCGYLGNVRRKLKDLRINGEVEFLEGDEFKKAEQLMSNKYRFLYPFFRSDRYIFLKIYPTAILKEPDEEEEACD